ncbi:TSUP family transporter [Allosaccharopolyspora coralli]|uniref:Probable membrane transporter protein n=1 Tax=Allosaccharopolyspora coralli TaxID=2665642 RepID=A0A5Q3Q8A8_9PSEU|nr:sulfite exporter TauE/SafE family protein [Allosaccharopolyspora coralli]QGK70040.1 TSUP family transporter [Allosaccharopolyspora coralli]
MGSFVLLALAGLAGQLVDGALGMAFGVTSTTVLLAAGIAPAMASASTHLAEVGTTLASGLSHWRFGNVDWPKIGWLAVPGGISAFVGATFLTSIPAAAAEPVVAVILFGVGIYILLQFAVDRSGPVVRVRSVPRRFLTPLAVVAGFMDAVGGGGWGPVGSSTLLASRRMEPRKVVGTIAASEFIVTIGASLGFLFGLSASEIPFRVVAALLVGGVIAAPIAAWVVRFLNARLLGTLVGGVIVLTNLRTFLQAIGFETLLSVPLYAVLIAGWLTAIILAIRATRLDRQQGTKPAVEAEDAATAAGS